MERRHAAIFSILIIGLVVSQVSLFAAFQSIGKSETVVISKVIDGDTFESEGRIFRLLNVNTPERGQPYYNESSEFLTEYINRSVSIEIQGADKYRRQLVRLYAPNYLNLQLIEEGLATPFLVNKYEAREFVNAHRTAIENEQGMWEHSQYYGCAHVEIYAREEKVFITTRCDIDMEGWYLRDESRKIYKFKEPIDREVIVYSGKGNDSKAERYWGTTEVWNNERDSIYLFDSSHRIVFYDNYD